MTRFMKNLPAHSILEWSRANMAFERETFCEKSDLQLMKDLCDTGCDRALISDCLRDTASGGMKIWCRASTDWTAISMKSDLEIRCNEVFGRCEVILLMNQRMWLRMPAQVEDCHVSDVVLLSIQGVHGQCFWCSSRFALVKLCSGSIWITGWCGDLLTDPVSNDDHCVPLGVLDLCVQLGASE